MNEKLGYKNYSSVVYYTRNNNMENGEREENRGGQQSRKISPLTAHYANIVAFVCTTRNKYRWLWFPGIYTFLKFLTWLEFQPAFVGRDLVPVVLWIPHSADHRIIRCVSFCCRNCLVFLVLRVDRRLNKRPLFWQDFKACVLKMKMDWF